MGDAITRETWDAAENNETKLNILFDLVSETRDRVIALERRKRVDPVFALVGGIVGGIMAMSAKLAFWRE